MKKAVVFIKLQIFLSMSFLIFSQQFASAQISQKDISSLKDSNFSLEAVRLLIYPFKLECEVRGGKFSDGNSHESGNCSCGKETITKSENYCYDGSFHEIPPPNWNESVQLTQYLEAAKQSFLSKIQQVQSTILKCESPSVGGVAIELHHGEVGCICNSSNSKIPKLLMHGHTCNSNL